MREIILTNGMVTTVDDEDFDYLNQFRWSARKSRHKTYAIRMPRYGPRKEGKHQYLAMHRVILNAGRLLVDHINGDGLDNRKINLRTATHSENARNANRSLANTTGFKGVDFQKRLGRYRARITRDRKSISIGLFKTATEAALAYNDAALRYHGAFAKLNAV